MGVVYMPRDSDERSELATKLLAAAEEVGGDKYLVRTVTYPRLGFAVSREVAEKAGVTFDVDDDQEPGAGNPASFAAVGEDTQQGTVAGEAGDGPSEADTSGDGEPGGEGGDSSDGETDAPKKRGRPRKNTTEGA
jgi:hypothetical protein